VLPSLPDSLYGSLAPLRSALERATAMAELRARRCRGCFPLCQPPRSSRAQPSSSPPSPALRARARRPKPCWKHRSRRPPSPLTAGARGRATSGRLPAISDHQRVRAAVLMLHHHSTIADKLPSADIDKLQCLLCSRSRQGPRAEIR